MSVLTALRALLRRPSGGRVLPHRSDGSTPVMLSSGRLITDPDEAEALGLTADARRIRRHPTE